MRLKFDKKKKLLCVGVAVAGMLCGLSAAMYAQENGAEITEVERLYTAQKVQLYVNEDGDGEIPVTIFLEAKEHSNQEKEELLNLAYYEILDVIKGDNESLEQVTTDLKLVYNWNISNEEIQVFWTIPKDIPISSYGNVIVPDERTEADIQVRLVLGEIERSWNIHIVLAGKEYVPQTLEEYIQEAVNDQKEKDKIMLPTDFQGKKLMYRSEQAAPAVNFLMPGVLAGVALSLYFYGREQRKKEDRKKQLEKDYPDFSMKISLLYGAGLSMQSIWERMLIEGTVGGYLKIEIEKTVLKIKGGIPESIVYWEFGERCGLPEYRRLAGILEQIVSKGSRGLTQMLDDTARDSLQERKAAIKRRGQEINTKLLIPMAMMLVVVIVIIMVPALTTMQSGM